MSDSDKVKHRKNEGDDSRGSKKLINHRARRKHVHDRLQSIISTGKVDKNMLDELDELDDN